MRWVVRLCVLSLVAMAGFVGGLTSGWPRAAAVDCGNFREQYFNPGTTWRGVKVSSPGMRVSDTVVDCSRISWVFVRNAAGTKIVNLGWYETEIGEFGCNPTAGKPKVLRIKQVNGIGTCDHNTHEYGTNETPTNDDFSIQDDNQDGVWEYRRNGVLVGSYDLGAFTNGILGAGSARYGASGDSMYGNFDGLKRMVPQGIGTVGTPIQGMETTPNTSHASTAILGER
jgi:hypothetical protein